MENFQRQYRDLLAYGFSRNEANVLQNLGWNGYCERKAIQPQCLALNEYGDIVKWGPWSAADLHIAVEVDEADPLQKLMKAHLEKFLQEKFGNVHPKRDKRNRVCDYFISIDESFRYKSGIPEYDRMIPLSIWRSPDFFSGEMTCKNIKIFYVEPPAVMA